VITPPGVTSGQGDDLGYHSYTTFQSGRPFNFGWIGTDGTIDYATRVIAHEVVETMTDPRLDGWHVTSAAPPENEIADNGAQAYSYRVNGYLVQPYWSQYDAAYMVNTGVRQTFYVKKDPNDPTGVASQLVINGDQLGYGYADAISIDVNAAGGMSVTLNGESVSFEPGQIDSIVVNTGAGANVVQVLGVAAGVELTINDGGSDNV